MLILNIDDSSSFAGKARVDPSGNNHEALRLIEVLELESNSGLHF
jgi:hypothetical protein